jgi:hypothetical protein
VWAGARNEFCSNSFHVKFFCSNSLTWAPWNSSQCFQLVEFSTTIKRYRIVNFF